MHEAFKKAVEERVREGLPMYVWRDGKIVAVPAEELLEKSRNKFYLLGIKVFWLAAQRQTPFCLIQVSVKRTR